MLSEVTLPSPSSPISDIDIVNMVLPDDEDEDGAALMTTQRPIKFDPDHSISMTGNIAAGAAGAGAAGAAAAEEEDDDLTYRQLHEDVGAAVPNESLNQLVTGNNTNTVSLLFHSSP